MLLRLLLISLTFLLTCAQLPGQGSALPVGDQNYDLLRRLTIKYGFENFAAPATNLSLQPLNRASLVQLAKTYKQLYGQQMSRSGRYRLQQFFNDNTEWLATPTLLENEDVDRAAYYLGEDFARRSVASPLYEHGQGLLNYFYTSPANLLEVNQKDFYLRLNPIIDVRYGKQLDDTEDYFFNQRGLSLRAGIDDRIFLQLDLLETQVGLPNYVRQYRDRFDALPGAGFLKDYELEPLNVLRGNDYLNGQGYVSADITRHIGARIGYGTHFIGDGERSLLLSNFSNNYPFLELNWRIWKFHYRNIFAELTAEPQRTTPSGTPLLKKYLAAHYLSINLGKRLTLGLFEAVVMTREDGFDLAYLNPVILYRTIEQSVGSPDNALIGLTARYRSPFDIELYGQLTLDEFKFDELFIERNGWWANKWAYQLGARYVDAFGIDQLDLNVERNVARPYIFSHRGQSSYTHFGMPLAHPLGANFSENLLGIDYRPLPRLHLRSRLYFIEQGEGLNGSVVGEDITISSNERDQDYGNTIGQGTHYNTRLLGLRAGYEIVPNLWFEGEFLYRNKDSDAPERDLSTTVINFGIRWNVARRDYAF